MNNPYNEHIIHHNNITIIPSGAVNHLLERFVQFDFY